MRIHMLISAILPLFVLTACASCSKGEESDGAMTVSGPSSAATTASRRIEKNELLSTSFQRNNRAPKCAGDAGVVFCKMYKYSGNPGNYRLPFLSYLCSIKLQIAKS